MAGDESLAILCGACARFRGDAAKLIPFGIGDKKSEYKSRSFTSFRMTRFVARQIPLGNGSQKNIGTSRFTSEFIHLNGPVARGRCYSLCELEVSL